ncbi:MAG: carboxypeptidase-like regulatory domain-containing protein [Bacteroidota bacterium]
MTRYIIVLFFNFASLIAFSQDYTTVSGRIIDLETKEPLSFATLGILNQPLGVVTDQDGYFNFNFPNEHLSDTILFSMLGYQTEKVLVQGLSLAQPNIIELVKKSVVLPEVVVTNKELTAWDIIELAKKNIRKNYPTEPFEFEAFYRDYKIENDQCVGIFEAACSVYDKGYSHVSNKYLLREKVILKQVRKRLSVNFQTHSFNRLNVLNELLRLNDVRYQSRALDKKGRRKYIHTIDGYDMINDRLMYRIKAVDTWCFYVFVDVATYAIPRIEMNYEWKDDIAENEWTLGDTIKYRQRMAKETLEFQLINGRYYPKYNSFKFSLEATDPATDSLLFTSSMLQQYLVTDIDFAPKEKPEKSDRMDPGLKIEDQTFTYDPEFWKNYNILKLHSRDEELIRVLEDQMKLKDQVSTK